MNGKREAYFSINCIIRFTFSSSEPPMSAKSSTTVLSTPHSRLIIDFFSTSALPIAKELHLPTYYFYTSGHPNVQPMLDRDHPAYWDDMLYFCSHLPKSDGIIDNTFEELEPTSTLFEMVPGILFFVDKD
ncbi:hypothetical protein PS2_004321 [Malus domestica]